MSDRKRSSINKLNNNSLRQQPLSLSGYGDTKCKIDDMVLLHLLTSFCRPLLVYGAECTKFTPGYDNAAKSSCNYILCRSFRVSDALADDMSQFTGTSTITSFVLQLRIKFRQKRHVHYICLSIFIRSV